MHIDTHTHTRTHTCKQTGCSWSTLHLRKCIYLGPKAKTSVCVCVCVCALERSVLGLRCFSEEKRRASAAVFPVSQCLLRQTLHSHAYTFCWSLCGVIVAVNGHNHSSWAHVNSHSHSVTTQTMIFNKFVAVHNRRHTGSSSCFPSWLELAGDTTAAQLTQGVPALRTRTPCVCTIVFHPILASLLEHFWMTIIRNDS